MHRRKTLAAVVVLMLAVVTGPAFSQADHDEHGEQTGHEGQMTLRGEILDMACYMAHEAQGPDHAGCAKRCLAGGQPMGLLAEDGTVYLLYANHEDGSAFEAAKEQAGAKVEITGIASSRGGMRGLEVVGVKAL